MIIDRTAPGPPPPVGKQYNIIVIVARAGFFLLGFSLIILLQGRY